MSDKENPKQPDLVAYLDGELDDSDAKTVEMSLSSDPAARSDAESLEKTWRLLDHLPQVEASGALTTRTLTSVQKNRSLRWRAQVKYLGWLVVLVAIGWISAEVGSALKGRRSHSLPEIEPQALLSFASWEQLRQLEQAGGLEAFGIDVPDTRMTKIKERLTPEQRQDLERKLRELSKVARADRESLIGVAAAFHRWTSSLPVHLRDQLRQPAEEDFLFTLKRIRAEASRIANERDYWIFSPPARTRLARALSNTSSQEKAELDRMFPMERQRRLIVQYIREERGSERRFVTGLPKEVSQKITRFLFENPEIRKRLSELPSTEIRRRAIDAYNKANPAEPIRGNDLMP